VTARDAPLVDEGSCGGFDGECSSSSDSSSDAVSVSEASLSLSVRAARSISSSSNSSSFLPLPLRLFTTLVFFGRSGDVAAVEDTAGLGEVTSVMIQQWSNVPALTREIDEYLNDIISKPTH
jgi:hypothetical protein